jgi:hypothetical protein
VQSVTLFAVLSHGGGLGAAWIIPGVAAAENIKH